MKTSDMTLMTPNVGNDWQPPLAAGCRSIDVLVRKLGKLGDWNRAIDRHGLAKCLDAFKLVHGLSGEVGLTAMWT